MQNSSSAAVVIGTLRVNIKCMRKYFSKKTIFVSIH